MITKFGVQEYKKQWYAAFVSLFFTTCYGACEGFSSILLTQLQKPNSTIPISNEESSWIASIFWLPGPVGSLTVGILMEMYGRTKIIQLAYLFMFIGWGIIAQADSSIVLCIGRLMTGLAVGMEPAVLVYVTEVVLLQSQRSVILTLLSPLLYIGVAMSYLVGYLLAWRYEAAFMSLLAALGFLLMFTVPESPTWLVSKGNSKKAHKALSWLTNDSTFIEQELSRLQKDSHQSAKKDDENNSDSIIRAIISTGAWKPFLIVLAFLFFQQFSGYKVLIFYAASIYESFGAPINSYLSAIIFASLIICSSLMLTGIVERFQRRTLMAISATGVGLLCAFASAHGYIFAGCPNKPLLWLPVACIWATVIFAMGLNTMTWIMATDMFPAKVRASLISALWSASFIIAFATVKSYPFAASLLQVQGVLAVFAGVAFAALLSTFLLLPETRGKSVQEMEQYWLPKN